MASTHKLNYASKTPKSAARPTTAKPATDFIIPLGLLIAGLLLYAVGGMMHVGKRDLQVYMILIAVAAVIETVLRVIAAFITAAVIGTSFGEVKTALLKLAGIFIFVGGFGTLFGGASFIGAIFALGLLMWLFEMEMFEAVVFTVISWVVGLGAGLLAAAMLSN